MSRAGLGGCGRCAGGWGGTRRLVAGGHGRGGAGADAGRGVGLAGVAPGRFLLIAGEDGQAWCEAARQLAAEANVFIAWRHPAGTGDPRAALAAALSQILARPVGAPVASAA